MVQRNVLLWAQCSKEMQKCQSCGDGWLNGTYTGCVLKLSISKLVQGTAAGWHMELGSSALLFHRQCAVLIFSIILANIFLSNASQPLVRRQDRICGSEVAVWAETTSAAFRGTILFGLTGGRARFCSCSSFLSHFLPALPRSAVWQSPAWPCHNFCFSAWLSSLSSFYSDLIFPFKQVFIIWFFVLSLFFPSVTGRCGLRTGVSYSHSDCVSLESLPVSHTALLFTAFRQRIKEVCHATSWIRNGVWLPFVLHRNLALGRPSA